MDINKLLTLEQESTSDLWETWAPSTDELNATHSNIYSRGIPAVAKDVKDENATFIVALRNVSRELLTLAAAVDTHSRLTKEYEPFIGQSRRDLLDTIEKALSDQEAALSALKAALNDAD